MGIETLGSLGAFEPEEEAQEKLGNKKFLAQFNKRTKAKVAGGTAEVARVTPEVATDDIPLLLDPAWGCTMEIYRGAIQTATEKGREVVTFNHPRLGGNIKKAAEKLDVDADEALKEYPREEVRRALNSLGVLEEEHIEKVDAIGHSQGSVDLIVAAMLNPEKFRNLVLVGPAGLIENDSFGRILDGFRQQKHTSAYSTMEGLPISKKEERRALDALTFIKESVEFFGSNPIRSIAEGKALGQIQLFALLRYLRQQGIGISVIAGAEDPVFPPELMNKEGGPIETDMLDGFLSVTGGHGALGENPERFMSAALDLLRRMKNRRPHREVSLSETLQTLAEYRSQIYDRIDPALQKRWDRLEAEANGIKEDSAAAKRTKAKLEDLVFTIRTIREKEDL